MHSLTIKINTQTSSGHCTQRVRGQSGASTSSAQAAAERLADKLYGPFLLSVRFVRRLEEGHVEEWCIQHQGEPIAWCWPTGVIHFGVAPVPKGALQIAEGPYVALVEDVTAKADRSKGAAALYVPGMAEAPDRTAALHALATWLHASAVPDSKKGAYPVKYANSTTLGATVEATVGEAEKAVESGGA